jgi:DNA repair exonuclease SbcCD ATPase subunit
MTILLKDLTVKNFMSVGNQTQAVRFDQEQLTLVLGENLDQGGDDSGSRNGTGKTTIINGLSYALYGQALTNIKRNNLINKTNGKHMLVTLNFEKNNVQYRIERGRSPTFTKFYVNDQEQDFTDESQGDSRKTQEAINDLLGMSHDMFKHIVALNTYSEPFLAMRTNDQRAIIEQLLGITILSEKAETLKEEIRNTKAAIDSETNRINAIQSANERIEDTISSLGRTQKAWQAKKRTDVSALEEAIQELSKLDIDSEIESHEKLQNWQKISAELDNLQKELASAEAAQSRAQKSVDKINKDIADLEDAECYACGQPLHEDKKQEILATKTKELEESRAYLQEVTEKAEKTLENIKIIGDIDAKPTVFYESMKEAYEHRQNIDGLKHSLETKEQEQDPYQSQIDELSASALQEINWDSVNELTNYQEHQEFLLKLLTNKDSFIRKKIIDQNLSYLNNRLTSYLAKLGLPHQVAFQNDLSVEITQLGQDLDFDNLSRGERNRLILGLSFAFRDVWENLYQNINLLFIDELIDSGMDSAGVENALGVIKHMGREGRKNVFLISHKEELVGRVNHVLRVVKESGFTSYATDLDVVD